jgi:hypothetical protein
MEHARGHMHQERSSVLLIKIFWCVCVRCRAVCRRRRGCRGDSLLENRS